MSNSTDVDMHSQGTHSDNSDMESEPDDSSYYNDPPFDEALTTDPAAADIEYFKFKCLLMEDVQTLLNESIEEISKKINVSPPIAKQLLHAHQWEVSDIEQQFSKDPTKMFVDARIKAEEPPSLNNNQESMVLRSKSHMCDVCYVVNPVEKTSSMACGHKFCDECWAAHLRVKIHQGMILDIECMANDCNLLVPEDFVLDHVSKEDIRSRYQQYAFNEMVKAHPRLRFCPGPSCPIIVFADEAKSKRAICDSCKTSFCFKCGIDYHAPTDCDVIKRWIVKCADDSETANYISAHTKDCPRCHVCIEKNGGCNHLQCANCKHDFCWMCLGAWRFHGSEYYECSRYKENPNIANESEHAQAREALKKYLFYFERWENHSKSLALEKQMLAKIQERMNDKIIRAEGTWIDWQYLLDSASLLTKCRYTLQYTYPYAYYMESNSRKSLFEYQQSQLEAEIENLSWKVERAETHSRGDIENQMDVCEKRRATLLRDFLTA